MPYDRTVYGGIIQPALVYLKVIRAKLDRILGLLILAVLPVWANAQVLSVKTDNPEILELISDLNKLDCIDSECEQTLEHLVRRLQSRGYMLASLRERIIGDTLEVFVSEGPRFTYGNIEISDLPPPLLNQIEFPEKKVFSPQFLDSLYEVILVYAENNGYPTASVGMDSIKFVGSEINGRISYDPGPQIFYGKVTDISGKYSSSWLTRRSGLVPGNPYRQKEVDILKLSLIRAGIPVNSIDQVITGNTVDLKVETGPTKPSRFDGLVGLQQNPVNGKATLAGYLDLQLGNLFRAARRLNLHWERLRPSTQEIMVNYYHPSILRNVDMGIDFNLIRMDTSYLNRVISAKIQTALTPHASISAIYRYTSSNLLDRPQISDIPDAYSGNLQYGGIGLLWTGSGMELSTEIMLGGKKLRASSSSPSGILNGNESSIYQWSFNSTLSKVVNLNNIWQLKSSAQAGIVNSDELYQNDLFLLGGLNSIRGFNERSFFASSYGILQIEPRLKVSSSSFLLAFMDYGIIKFPLESGTSGALGWGTGIDLETSTAARLRFLIAWGKQESEPVDFANPLIHIGFISEF